MIFPSFHQGNSAWWWLALAIFSPLPQFGQPLTIGRRVTWGKQLEGLLILAGPTWVWQYLAEKQLMCSKISNVFSTCYNYLFTGGSVWLRVAEKANICEHVTSAQSAQDQCRSFFLMPTWSLRSLPCIRHRSGIHSCGDPRWLVSPSQGWADKGLTPQTLW